MSYGSRSFSLKHEHFQCDLALQKKKIVPDLQSERTFSFFIILILLVRKAPLYLHSERPLPQGALFLCNMPFYSSPQYSSRVIPALIISFAISTPT